jgi:hypothetical protein
MSNDARPGLPGSPASAGASGKRWQRWLRRGPWEAASALLIGLGLFMLMQPIALVLYSYSFVVILAGTLGFLVTSHFPD